MSECLVLASDSRCRARTISRQSIVETRSYLDPSGQVRIMGVLVELPLGEVLTKGGERLVFHSTMSNISGPL